MNPASLDIAQRLAAQGHGFLGGAATWSIRVAKEPQTPDGTITLYDTSGESPDPDSDYWRPSVQVRVRHNNYGTAYAKMEDIVNELTTDTLSFEINGTRYVGIYQFGSPQFLAFDDNDRAILVANFNIVRQTA